MLLFSIKEKETFSDNNDKTSFFFNPDPRDKITNAMQCERLIKQIKIWYSHVQNETMAPARMISFIESHASQCDICLADPDLHQEITRITEIILPESKIPKAVRLQQEQAEENELGDEEESTDETEETEEETEDDLDIFDPDDEI